MFIVSASAGAGGSEGRNLPCRGNLFPKAEMTGGRSAEVTDLLKAWNGGNRAALDQLSPVVYDELRRMARRYMRNERVGKTLQATALVNEVYLRLVDVKSIDWKQRAQFFGMCAQMMRRILVDAARARGSLKRGGDVVRVDFDEGYHLSNKRDAAIVALDEALEAFSKVAPRQAKVLELRYFSGLNVEEINEVLGIAPRTIERDWEFAKAWLTRELNRT
jgi:RNA polymerase sigma factor (TIGR02999 family)